MTLEEPYGFIYITTNIINGKRYIGQRRFINNWESYLGSGQIIKKAIKKYGKENFFRDIIEIAYSKEELNKLEEQWIESYNATKRNDFYNIAHGGNSGSKFEGKSEYEMLKIKQKISKSNKNKIVSIETRQKMSKIAKNNFTTGKVKPWNKGKIGLYNHSEKTKEKDKYLKNGIPKSEAYKGENNPNYGNCYSEEIKDKMKLIWKERIDNGYINPFKGLERPQFNNENNPNAKEVFVYDSNMNLYKHFFCYKDCSEWMISIGLCKTEGTARDRIRKCIKDSKIYKDYYFRKDGDVLCQSA